MSWLQKHSTKLVDVNDLVLLQHLMTEYGGSWFTLSKQDITKIINIKSPLRGRNRRNRLIRDGILEERILDSTGTKVFRLVDFYV